MIQTTGLEPLSRDTHNLNPLPTRKEPLGYYSCDPLLLWVKGAYEERVPIDEQICTVLDGRREGTQEHSPQVDIPSKGPVEGVTGACRFRVE